MRPGASDFFDRQADTRDAAKARWRYYHRTLERLCTSIIPPHARVLEVGCGTGDLLHAVRPSLGVGVDVSRNMVEIAGKKYPGLRFVVGDAEALPFGATFDYIILSELVGHLQDVWQAFQELHRVSHPGTRIIVIYYNDLWELAVGAGELLRLKTRQPPQNWLTLEDISNLFYLTDFDEVTRGQLLLLPVSVPLVTSLVNGVLARLPVLRSLQLVQYVVARPIAAPAPPGRRGALTCSVIVPCRNERGNIESLFERLPAMGADLEIILVDGNSTDGTREKIKEMIRRLAGRRKVSLLVQAGPRGKADAVRMGFDAATGDVLMILDADLTVAPEDLPKFYDALAMGKGEFINGSRLVYPLEQDSMRTLNLWGNKFFGWLFSWLLGQRVKDTLCGTKALFRQDYAQMKRHALVSDGDPFGDFNLLLGAARLNLKIVDVPVRYYERVYGATKIRRFKHGWMLLRLALIAGRKLKKFR